MKYFTIGRFQPPNDGHYGLLENICSFDGNTDILVGIVDTGVRSCSNPLSYDERVSVMEDFGFDIDFFPFETSGATGYMNTIRYLHRSVPRDSIFFSGDAKDRFLASVCGYETTHLDSGSSVRSSNLRKLYMENDPSWTEGLARGTEDKILKFFRNSGFSADCLRRRGIVLKY